MLRSVKDLIGHSVIASDGRVGRVADCLFEDESWRMRHLVLDTGRRLRLNLHYLSEEEDPMVGRRRVLIEPEDLQESGRDGMRPELSVGLTKDAIAHSPSSNTDMPISEQYEWEFSKYYRHRPYGDRPRVDEEGESKSYTPPVSAYSHDRKEIEDHQRRIREIGNCHLYSAMELMGYRVFAADGSSGEVVDFILHEGDWVLRQMVVRMGGVLTRRNLLVRMNAISDISWSDEAISLDMLVEEVEDCPDFRPHAPVNRDRSQHYYDYYGKLRGRPRHLATH